MLKHHLDKLILIVCSFFLLYHTAFASDFKIDSLLEAYKNTTDLKEKFDINLKLTYLYLYEDLNAAENRINAIFEDGELLQSLPDTFFRHLLLKAWVHQGKYELNTSKLFYEQAISKAENLYDQSEYIKLLLNYSSLLVDSKDNTAFVFISKVHQAIDTSLDINQKIIWNLSHQLQSRAYANREEYKKAINVLIKIMKAPFFKDLSDQRFGVFNSFSVYLNEFGDFDLSYKYLIEALKQKNLYDFEKKVLLSNMIELFLGQEKLDSALIYMNRYERFQPYTDAECQTINYLKSKYSFQTHEYYKGREELNEAVKCSENIEDGERTLMNCLLSADYAIVEGNKVLLSKAIKQAKWIIKNDENLMTASIHAKVSEIELKENFLTFDPILLGLVDTFVAATQKQYSLVANRQIKELSVEYETHKKDDAINRLREKSILQAVAIKNKRMDYKVHQIGFVLIRFR